MNFEPQIRFSLTWTPIVGDPTTLTNQNPVGWETIKMVLERDGRFHSVHEFLEADLIFIGAAYNFIKQAETDDGLDADVEIFFEIHFQDSVGWEPLYTGVIDIKALRDSTDAAAIFFKLSVPILRNNLWTKFITRLNVPVDIQKDRDEDDVAVDVITPKTQSLPSQRIKQIFSGTFKDTIDGTHPQGKWMKFNKDEAVGNFFGAPEFARVLRDEIKERHVFDAESDGSRESFPEISFTFKTQFAGSYRVNYQIIAVQDPVAHGHVDATTFRIAIDDESPGTAFTQTDVGGVSDGYSKFEYDHTYDLPAGATIRIWCATGDFLYIGVNHPDLPETFGEVTAQTDFPATSCPGFLAHDVGYAIVDRILGQSGYHKFYSEALGHTSYTARVYGANGCLSKYALTRGNQVRTFSLAAKPQFWSMNEYFAGLDNIFMMGLGRKTIAGQDMIIMEQREKFFDITAMSVVFTSIKKFTRSHDLDLLTKKVTIGYSNAEAEDFGVLDDPQGSVNYTTRYERLGNERNLESTFLAAGLAIEGTRRKAMELNKDWRFDKVPVIVAINPTITADLMLPELDENFSAISGLENSDSRYNLRLWPVFNLLRHLPQLKIGLQAYGNSLFKFAGGNLNVEATGTMAEASDCLMVVEEPYSQKQDVSVTTLVKRYEGPLHGDELLEFEHPLAWSEYKLLRDSPEKAIGMTTSSDPEDVFDDTFDDTFHETVLLAHKGFIKRIAWHIYNQSGEFQIWKAV